MQTLAAQSSVTLYLASLIATHAALSAANNALAPVVQQKVDAGDALVLQSQKHDRAGAAITGRTRFWDSKLDQTCMGLAKALVLVTNGDRTDLLYTRFFGEAAPSVFIKTSMREQADTVLRIFVPALEALADGHLLKTYIPQLKEAATQLISALDDRRDLQTLQDNNSHSIKEWKESVNTLRTSVYNRLQQEAIDRGDNRKEALQYAEGFFSDMYDNATHKKAKSTDDVTDPEIPQA